MFDKIYLQKCEYSGDKIIDTKGNNELYKGLLSFNVVGLKENVPYIIKSVLEQNIDGKWIKDQILDSLKTLKVVYATFFLVCFVCLKESIFQTRKNVFYFTSKALFLLEIIRF